MKFIKTGLLISLLLFQPLVSAEENTGNDKDGIGFGLGAIIGGLLAGPPGIVIGAASGGFFGAHEEQHDNEIAELEAELNAKSIELAYQQNELAKTRAGFEKEFQQVMLNREIRELEKLSQGISYVIYYKTNDTKIQSEVVPRIAQLAELIKPYPQIKVRIEGFADERGSDSYNLQLSKQRIRTVQQEFINAGISSKRLQTQAFGEKQANAVNGDLEGYIFDRRVTINLTLDHEV